MSIVSQFQEHIRQAFQEVEGLSVGADSLTVNQTSPDFEGDYTLVLFSFLKQLKRSPEQLGQGLGDWLLRSHPGYYAGYNVVKGFLNVSIQDEVWMDFLEDASAGDSVFPKSGHAGKLMVEYSSPNTNKPLHLGHLRNNFLGWSIAEIYKKNGFEVVKTCIANDRGIHICKSMVAWQLFGNGATPETTGIKGDHLVGDYYVLFGNELKEQIKKLVSEGVDPKEAEKNAPIMQAAQQMLVDWEAGKPEVVDLWKKMNGWVYKGFDKTYQRIGTDFDKVYYESETYLLGKKAVAEGLEKGVFFRKEDGSVWIDLTADGLDEKVVQRKDGTAVYITQDIGLAEVKQEEFGAGQSIYVVGDEQNYHFKVLKLICLKLGVPGADGIYHLSYGMVELPTGRMKTREGTVVDADDMVDEMVAVARQKTESLGKVEGFTESELKELYDVIGLGALKFFLLRVDPKKRMVFNPEESIDFHGFTGPFIQYTYARIRSMIRKAESLAGNFRGGALEKLEKEVLVSLEQYAQQVRMAGLEHNPSLLAIYAFQLAQLFNSFYTAHSVLNAETPEKRVLRLKIAELTSRTLKEALGMLGIAVPERM